MWKRQLVEVLLSVFDGAGLALGEEIVLLSKSLVIKSCVVLRVFCQTEGGTQRSLQTHSLFVYNFFMAFLLRRYSMSLLSNLPDNTVRRLFKVILRTLHLVGIAGTFGDAMMGVSASPYITLAIYSGIVLVVMEAYSGLIWFVQIRAVAVYLKLLLLLFMHLYPQFSIPSLIVIIVLSGFVSHAPSWIRYYSVQHGRMVHSKNDLMG